VVLVVDEVVVEFVAVLFLEDSSSNPASSSATSSTERIIRKGQRCGGWESGELGIASTVTVEGLSVAQEIGSEQRFFVKLSPGSLPKVIDRTM
jgi:hypothetical protein